MTLYALIIDKRGGPLVESRDFFLRAMPANEMGRGSLRARATAVAGKTGRAGHRRRAPQINHYNLVHSKLL